MPMPRRAKSRKGMVLRSIALDPDMRKQLTLAGLDTGLTVNELLRRIIREWLIRHHASKKRRPI